MPNTPTISPGLVLQDEIRLLGINAQQLANLIGLSDRTTAAILNDEQPITRDIALRLQMITRVKTDAWLDIDSKYRIDMSMCEGLSAIEKEVYYLPDFDASYMEKYGWIPSRESRTDKVRVLRDFLGISSLTRYRSLYESTFRRSNRSMGSLNQSLTSWLRQGEVSYQEIQTALHYDPDAFEDALNYIKTLTITRPEHFLSAMFNRCAEAGVTLAFTPELPNCKVNGVTRRSSDGKPYIQISLNSRGGDKFWMTFFHEAKHVLDHEGDFYISFPHESPILPTAEIRAQRFASDMLISRADWSTFVESGDFSSGSIEVLAQHVGIHPGIVVGRLEQDLIPTNSQSDALRLNYAWPRIQVGPDRTHVNRTSRAAADSTPDESPAACSAPSTHCS